MGQGEAAEMLQRGQLPCLTASNGRHAHRWQAQAQLRVPRAILVALTAVAAAGALLRPWAAEAPAAILASRAAWLHPSGTMSRRPSGLPLSSEVRLRTLARRAGEGEDAMTRLTDMKLSVPKAPPFVFSARGAGSRRAAPAPEEAPSSPSAQDAPAKETKEGATQAGSSSDTEAVGAQITAAAGSSVPAYGGLEATQMLRSAAIAAAEGTAASESSTALLQLGQAVEREAERGGLEAEDLSSSLWSVAMLRELEPGLQVHIPGFADSLLGRAMDLEERGVADALWACAELRRDAPMLQEIADMLWALTMLRTMPAQASAHKVIAQPDAGVNLEALADLLVQEIQKRTDVTTLASHQQELSAHTTYSVMYAVTTLQDTVVSETVKALLPDLRAALEANAQFMNTAQISTCLWCLGALEPESKAAIETIKRIRDEVGYALTEMRLPQLAMSVWTFAALAYDDQELLDISVERLLMLAPSTKPGNLAKELPRLIWAYSKLWRIDEVTKELPRNRFGALQLLSEYMKPEKGVLRYFSPDGLHSLSWAFKILDPDGRLCGTFLQRNLQAKLKLLIKMKYKHATDWSGSKRVAGRLEEYMPIEEGVKVTDRNRVMLEKAISLGQRGPDVNVDRRPVSGRLRIKDDWVQSEERFQVSLGASFDRLKLGAGLERLGSGDHRALHQGNSVKAIAGGSKAITDQQGGSTKAITGNSSFAITGGEEAAGGKIVKKRKPQQRADLYQVRSLSIDASLRKWRKKHK
ncbi:unnamed protein product [Polarella glacialis]|uniref:Uncharacterized protein n=1 Tax=Polarella glacialis TaxID=89957 RepID=A0A813L9E0_POLGL|nr:unnamed protein product [Polarella glacialis]